MTFSFPLPSWFSYTPQLTHTEEKFLKLKEFQYYADLKFFLTLSTSRSRHHRVSTSHDFQYLSNVWSLLIEILYPQISLLPPPPKRKKKLLRGLHFRSQYLGTNKKRSQLSNDNWKWVSFADLLSRLVKVCLKKTVKRFHVFLFCEQDMVG